MTRRFFDSHNWIMMGPFTEIKNTTRDETGR